MANNNFDAKNLLSICLQNSPKIFAIVQKFALDNFRDQQFCNLLCELERVMMVLFTGNALEVEVPPGMVWARSRPIKGLFFLIVQSRHRSRDLNILNRCRRHVGHVSQGLDSSYS